MNAVKKQTPILVFDEVQDSQDSHPPPSSVNLAYDQQRPWQKKYIIHDMKGEQGDVPRHVCEAGPGSFQWKKEPAEPVTCVIAPVTADQRCYL